MRKIIATLAGLIAFSFTASLAHSQQSSNFTQGPSLPATCFAGQLFNVVSGGVATPYTCSVINTWERFGSVTLVNGTANEIDVSNASASPTISLDNNALASAGLPIFSVTNPAFGGVCNTYHDDTAAIAAAATAANNAHGILYIPAVAGAVFTGSISGTVLTVTAIQSGQLAVGQYIQGGAVYNTSVPPLVTSFGTGTGGIGTYNIDYSYTIGSETLTGISTCLTSNPVVVTSADLWIDGGLRGTTSGMSSVVQWGAAGFINSHHRIYGSGIIDANNTAQRHISLYNYAHVEITGVHLYNSATVAGIDVGPTGSVGGYEAYIHDTDELVPAGTANTSGAPGVWLNTGTDSDIDGLAIVGFDNCVTNNIHNNQPIKDIHCWGYGPHAPTWSISNLPTNCFVDAAGDQRWFGDECDTSSGTGFLAESYYTIIDHFLYYNNTWGTNNVVTGIQFTQANPYSAVTNSQFYGYTGYHLLNDITVPTGNFSTLTLLGNSSPQGVTNSYGSAPNLPSASVWGNLNMESQNTSVAGTNYESNPFFQYATYWNGTASANAYCESFLNPSSASASNPNYAWKLYCSGLGSGATYNLDLSGTTGLNLLGAVQFSSQSTTSNCVGTGSPAACGSASAGAVQVFAGGGNTTEVVDTTAVTANSEIKLTFDSSLGTRLSTTCNTTINQPTVSARAPGVSFTITMANAVSSTNDCISYEIIN